MSAEYGPFESTVRFVIVAAVVFASLGILIWGATKIPVDIHPAIFVVLAISGLVYVGISYERLIGWS